MDENSETESSPLSTQSVFDNYLKEPILSRKSNPLAYWKSNQDNLPHLISLARQYLCAPPATDLHNCLTPTKVEYLLFLNKNLLTVDF